MEDVLEKLYDAVLERDFEGVKTNVQASLEAGLEPGMIQRLFFSQVIQDRKPLPLE